MRLMVGPPPKSDLILKFDRIGGRGRLQRLGFATTQRPEDTRYATIAERRFPRTRDRSHVPRQI